MQQRVGIARALAVEPDVLLMDEPFGALDAQTRLILQDELLRICGAYKATVMFITHDIEEAIYLSDQIVVMSRRPGEIKFVVDVNLPKPRYEHDVRSSPEFLQLRATIWNALREEIQEASTMSQSTQASCRRQSRAGSAARHLPRPSATRCASPRSSCCWRSGRSAA